MDRPERAGAVLLDGDDPHVLQRPHLRQLLDHRDELLLGGPDVGRGEPVGGRGELDRVGQALVRRDLLDHLVAGPRGGQRRDHVVRDDLRESARDPAGPERRDDRLLLVGEVVEGEEVGVRAHRRVEADHPRAATPRHGRVRVDGHAGRGDDVQRGARPAAPLEAGVELGEDPVAQERRRRQLVGDPAVADLAGQPGHQRPHRGQVDRDVGPGDGVGALVAADPHRLALAVQVDRLAAGARRPEGTDVADRLAQLRDGLGPVDVVPVLVEPLDAGAEAEDQASAGELVEVEGLERGDHRAPREGERDGRPDLGGPGRLGDRRRGHGRAAVQLGHPVDLGAGLLGGARRLGDLGQGLAPGPERDPQCHRRSRQLSPSSAGSGRWGRCPPPARRRACRRRRCAGTSTPRRRPG